MANYTAMRKKLLTTALLILAGVAVCLAIAADLNGKWGGVFKTPQGDLAVQYTFKVDGDKLSGSVDSDQGSLPISDGKISGNDFTFSLDFNGTAIKNTGKYYGDSVVIDADVNGTGLHGVLKRVADEKK